MRRLPSDGRSERRHERRHERRRDRPPSAARPLVGLRGAVPTDVREVRRLIARGQTTAADQLLHGMHDSAIIAGLSLDDAGANRPITMRPRPTGEARAEVEQEANE